MAILKLAQDDPKKELEFEVRAALQMIQGDRIHKMLELSKECSN